MFDHEQKKDQLETDKRKSFVPLIAIGLVVLIGFSLISWKFASTPLGKYPVVNAVNGLVVIPVSQIENGKVHFFSYTLGELSVDYFAVRSHDGVLRTAFDACVICYRDKKGYRQEGEEMVCINCGQRFSSDRINEGNGGCNPVPLPHKIINGKIVINEQDLQAGVRYFEDI